MMTKMLSEAMPHTTQNCAQHSDELIVAFMVAFKFRESRKLFGNIGSSHRLAAMRSTTTPTTFKANPEII
jgi:hypothetical protein